MMLSKYSVNNIQNKCCAFTGIYNKVLMSKCCQPHGQTKPNVCKTNQTKPNVYPFRVVSAMYGTMPLS